LQRYLIVLFVADIRTFAPHGAYETLVVIRSRIYQVADDFFFLPFSWSRMRLQVGLGQGEQGRRHMRAVMQEALGKMAHKARDQ